MSLGDKLREFGKRSFSNTTDFAKALEMTQPSLSLYLNGHREPGTGILKKLLKLGCDLNWLLDDDIDMENSGNQTNQIAVEMKRLMEENAMLKTKVSQIASIADMAEAIKKSQNNKEE